MEATGRLRAAAVGVVLLAPLFPILGTFLAAVFLAVLGLADADRGSACWWRASCGRWCCWAAS